MLCVLSGCGLSSTKVEVADVSATSANIGAGAPKIASGDKLRVTVFNEPQLSGDFVVDKTGAINFPLLGQTNVIGLEPHEIELQLKKRLDGRFLVNAKVGVEILDQRPFYILGEVAKAGEYPYRPGLNVIGAIATAGGFSPRAQTARVSIRREGEDKARDYPVQSNVAIYPGDMITISERIF